MATTLEGIVTREGDEIKIAEYDTGKFHGAYELSLELPNIDVTTDTGVEAYKKKTGVDLSDEEQNNAQRMAEGFANEFNKALSQYGDTHFPKIYNELPDQYKQAVGAKYVLRNSYPDKSLKKGEEDKYETARSTARKHLDTVEAIEKDPNKYIAEKIEKLAKGNSLAGAYIARIIATFQNEYLEFEKQTAQRQAILAIDAYGFDKFVAKTRKHVSPLQEKLHNLDVDASKELQETMEREKPQTPEDIRKIRGTVSKKYQEKREEYLKKHPDALVIQDMNKEVIPMAYQIIDAKKKQEAAEKEKAEKERKGGSRRGAQESAPQTVSA